MSDEKKTETPPSYIHVGPQLENGAFSCIREDGDGSLHAGEVAPLEDGQALSSNQEVVILEATDSPTTLRIASSTGRLTSDGPAQVASRKYREEYDRIFGGTGTSKPGSQKNVRDLN